MKTRKSPPAKAEHPRKANPGVTAPSTTTMRFNAEDLYFLAALVRPTGISGRTDLLRHCIRIAARQYGIEPAATPGGPRAKS